MLHGEGKLGSVGRHYDFFSILISFSSIVHDIFHVYNIHMFIHTHAILHFYATKSF